MVKIFIGNIKEGSRPEDLKALFEKYGKVTECDILTNFGFVHMDSEDDAQKAVKALHESNFSGSNIRVELSHGRKGEKSFYRGGLAPRGAPRGGYRGGFGGGRHVDLYDAEPGYAEEEYGEEELYEGYEDPYYANGSDPYARDPYGAVRRPYAHDPYGRRPPVRADPYASGLAERRAPYSGRADPYYAGQTAAAADPYARADPYAARAADPYYAAARSDGYARGPAERADPYASRDPYAAAAARTTYEATERPAPALTSRVLDRPPPEYYRRATQSAAPAYYESSVRRPAAYPAAERARPF